VQITIIYDNESTQEDLIADHGFACVIEAYGRKILFDTGASGKILLENMRKLNIAPESIDEIFISHNHWDHTGGLSDLLTKHPFTVYLPPSCEVTDNESNIVFINKSTRLHENFFSTGELQKIEQSLVVRAKEGLVIIVGCSHSGVENILESASIFGKPIGLIGGLHDFEKYDLLKDLHFVCATHCTKHKNEIEELYPQKYVGGGVGKVIEVKDS
jgi:7,8-dihydropterin-6-yl-methyl-4-(beta-D-ribofuranosyl)aminobenzene 5'-phosphate synthase